MNLRRVAPTVATVALLGALAAPAGAADFSSWDSAPVITEAQAPGVTRAFVAAVEYWATVPGAPTVGDACDQAPFPRVVPDDTPAVAHGRPRIIVYTRSADGQLVPEWTMDCRMWFEQATLDDYARFGYQRPETGRAMCEAITHGLGSTPTAVLVTSTNRFVIPEANTFTSTTFTTAAVEYQAGCCRCRRYQLLLARDRLTRTPVSPARFGPAWRPPAHQRRTRRTSSCGASQALGHGQ